LEKIYRQIEIFNWKKKYGGLGIPKLRMTRDLKERMLTFIEEKCSFIALIDTHYLGDYNAFSTITLWLSLIY